MVWHVSMVITLGVCTRLVQSLFIEECNLNCDGTNSDDSDREQIRCGGYLHSSVYKNEFFALSSQTSDVYSISVNQFLNKNNSRTILNLLCRRL